MLFCLKRERKRKREWECNVENVADEILLAKKWKKTKQKKLNKNERKNDKRTGEREREQNNKQCYCVQKLKTLKYKVQKL